MKKNGFLIAALFIGLLCLSTAGEAQDYSYTSLIPSGWENAYGYAVNDLGAAVGWGTGGGYIYENGTYSSLNFRPYDINNSGQILGLNFLYDNGITTAIGPQSWTAIQAKGINNNGEIVGTGFDGSVKKSFLFSGGTYSELLPSGLESFVVNGINDVGDVVGYGAEAQTHLSTSRRFNYINNQSSTLNYTPMDINNSGHIVSTHSLHSGSTNTYIYPSDLISYTLKGVNNNGDVIGFGRSIVGYETIHQSSNSSYVRTIYEDRGFIAAPVVPEPASYVLLIVGAGIIGLRKFRSKFK